MQVILASGATEQELDADLQERLAEAEHQQDTDASLNSILVLSAQAEIDQLRSAVAASAQVQVLLSLTCPSSCMLLLLRPMCHSHMPAPRADHLGAAGPYTASSISQV